jgi:D-3-phosphoglycerate dehydrogenase
VRLCAGDVRVAATLVGPSDRERLVEVWGHAIDMEPADHMLFFRYTDTTGIVGQIGRALGEVEVNIASMQVSRQEAGGEALIAMAVDSAVPKGVVDEIAAGIGAVDARAIDLV